VDSVRAWRGLRRNEAYAAKLEKKLARRRDLLKAQDKAEKSGAVLNSNPFSVRLVFYPPILR
jgi:pre-rRNA-processing protein TSR4